MEWLLFWIFVLIIMGLALACCCVKSVRRACCWHGCNVECCKRLNVMTDDLTYPPIMQLKADIKMEKDKGRRKALKKELSAAKKKQKRKGSTYPNIFKTVKEIRKEQDSKTLNKKSDSESKTDIDRVEMQNIIKLQSQSSNVLEKDGSNVKFNKNLELKQDENGQFYLEKKWNIEKDTQVGTCMKVIYNSWLFSPTTFFLWEIGIVMLFSFFLDISLTSSVRTALDTYIVAFVGIFSVLLSLIFANGVEKNKENKRLFQALCGDIKAMAMYLGALTNNKDKYVTTDKDPNDENKGFATIRTRDTYEVEVEKIRLLLAVLAPVAKHVLRNAPSPNNPNYKKLDDKFRIRIEIPDETTCGGMIQQMLIRWGLVEPESNQDDSQSWANLNKNSDVNQIKVYLFEKIKKVSEDSGMDLFEVVMYCLLDAINELNELPYKYLGDARYSKERDLITKWQHIYGSWGTMASITTYRQPTLVHLTIFICLSLYTVATTVLNRNLAYVNFTVGDGGDPYSYYSDWTGSVEVLGDIDVVGTIDWWYFRYYVIVKSIFQILPFTWLYFLSNHIGKPFKKNMPDAEVISKDASDTQYQVSNLMANRACIDAWDMVQDYSKELSTLDRDTYKYTTGTLYPFRQQEEVKKNNIKKIRDSFDKKRQESRRNRKTKRRSLTPAQLEAASKATLEEGSKDKGGDDNEVRKRLPTTSETNTNTNNVRKIRFKNVNF